MKFKLIEQLKFKLSGRSVPVIKVSDVESDGRIRTLQMLGVLKNRPNSLLNTWDEKGYEKRGNGFITLVDEKGIPIDAYAVSEAGMTVDLYTIPPSDYPNREDVIGHAATMDDIADSMDLGKSMRNIFIGLFIGIALGWLIIGPIINKLLS